MVQSFPTAGLADARAPEPIVIESDSNREDAISAAIRGLTFVLDRFRYERMVLALGATAGLLLAVWSTFLAGRDGFDKDEVLLAFGPGGLFAAAGSGLTYYFQRAFKLVEQIVLRMER